VLKGCSNAFVSEFLQLSVDTDKSSLSQLLKLSNLSIPLGLSIAQTSLKEGLFQVRVASEIYSVHWGAQGFPVNLLNSLHALEVVLNMGRVLLCDDLDLVRFLSVVPRSEQEDKPLPLQGL